MFAIGLGASYAGQTLRRTLLDSSGVMVTGQKDLTTGFVEIGGGEYLLNYAALPDDHYGTLVIHIGSVGAATNFADVEVVAMAPIAPNVAQGGEIDGGTIDVVGDKTGYSLTAQGLDQISADPPSGDPTTFREKLMWDVQRRRNSSLTGSSFVTKDDGGGVITTQPVSDDGSTQAMGSPA
jgi:hypothetical protein